MSIGRWARAGLMAGVAVATSLVASPAPASAHPLGNFTVNRAVIVEVGPSAAEVRYVIDMAEIPAFSERRQIDADADGALSPVERDAWAESTCSSARGAVTVSLDGEGLTLADAAPPDLATPPGEGGLETVRLVCSWVAPYDGITGERQLDVRDLSDDGRLGWREVVIAAASGIEIVSSDVATTSPSQELSAYPDERLASPPDIRAGTATVRSGGVGGAGGVAASGTDAVAAAGPSDALAGLMSGGSLSLGLLAPLMAGLLGAAHAVSPGHGKTLVAAYVIGSRGTLRQAAVLGLTVAATHTVGVFVLGAVLLVGGELIVPEHLIIGLSLVAAALILALGAGMLWRAIADASYPRTHPHDHDHDHEHEHEHEHDHGHAHDHGHGHPHGRPDGQASDVPSRLRNVIALGLAGGMVPSASAVIVLLVAIGTGEVVYGLALIGAFGVGMALVLGGLALTTGWVRGQIAERAGALDSPLAQRAGRAVPFVAACAVLLAGVVTGVGALSQIL